MHVPGTRASTRSRGTAGACRRKTRSRSRDGHRALPNAMFRVELENGHKVLAHISGRCACTTSASCRAIGFSWSCRRTTSPEAVWCTAISRRRVLGEDPRCRRSSADEGSAQRQEDLRPCRVIRRRADPRHLHEPAAQAAAGLRGKRGPTSGSYRRRRPSARQAARHRADLHLRHRDAGGRGHRVWGRRRGRHKVRDLSEDEVLKIRAYIDANFKVEGPAPRGGPGHQAQDRDRLLPGHPTPPSAAGPRSAHPRTPYAQGSEEGDRRQEEGDQVARREELHMAKPKAKKTKRREEARRPRPGPHQVDVQQHDRHDHRPAGQHRVLGERRQRGLQGLAQVDAVRRAAGRREGRPRRAGARAAEGRRVREGPGFGPRDRDPIARRRASRSRASKT